MQNAYRCAALQTRRQTIPNAGLYLRPKVGVLGDYQHIEMGRINGTKRPSNFKDCVRNTSTYGDPYEGNVFKDWRRICFLEQISKTVEHISKRYI